MASPIPNTCCQGRTTMWILNEFELYKTVKLNCLDLAPEDDQTPRTNLYRKKVGGFLVHDIRKHQD